MPLVRSCLRKQLTILDTDGPAAASKSLKPIPCPTRPLLAWAWSRDDPQPSADTADGEGSGDTGGGEDYYCRWMTTTPESSSQSRRLFFLRRIPL